jgi:hypothetical protein
MMGLFKQMKDMKATVHAAPGLIQQGQEMAANAQAMQQVYAAQAQQAQAAQSAALAGAFGGATLTNTASTPVNGVDLPTYAWICKQVANAGYDQSLAHGFAAQKGLTSSDWDAAAPGWASRMATDPAVGREFRHYFDAA